MNKKLKQLIEYFYHNQYYNDIYTSIKTASLTSLIDEIVHNCFKLRFNGLNNILYTSQNAKHKFGDITQSVGWSDNFDVCLSFDDYTLYYVYVKFRDNRVIYFGNYEKGRQCHTIMDGEELTNFNEYLKDIHI